MARPTPNDCGCEGEVHEICCPDNPDYDPTPWCANCGARREENCDCGPLPDND
jgi:hypothetical protein